ncbi:DUF3052 family protein [Streptomyces sp. NPDC003007]|jgi:hypothetical protein
MSVSAGGVGKVGIADRLGIEPGMVVQELGRGERVDQEVRRAVEARAGSVLLNADADQAGTAAETMWCCRQRARRGAPQGGTCGCSARVA